MVPSDRRYSESDEWLLEEDGSVKIGLSDYAQRELGEIVFVELPAVGGSFSAGDSFAVVESVKAAAEVYTQCSGTVLEVNAALSADPGLINRAPWEAWIARFAGTLDGELMDAADYAAKIAK